MTKLVRYDAMRQAVAACVQIDEAAKIHDQAACLAAYARQRDDREVERWLAEIKVRAAAKIGELSRQLKHGQGGRPKNLLPGGTSFPQRNPGKNEVLKHAGISPVKASQFEELSIRPTEAERYYDDCRATGKAPSLRGFNLSQKIDRRADKEVELARSTARLSEATGKQLYSVIYADPPWKYVTWSLSGTDRLPDYPTMTLKQVCALGPDIPAAKHCTLFLWITNPLLFKGGPEVLEAWGFEYKANFVWVKPTKGIGHWNGGRHETLLLATRGKPPAPALGMEFDSVIEAARGKRHSEKPEAAAKMIERMFPNQVWFEMFARVRRPGWISFGNELPAAA